METLGVGVIGGIVGDIDTDTSRPLLNTGIKPPTAGDGNTKSSILSRIYTAAEIAHAFNGFPRIYFLALPLAVIYLGPSLYMLIAAGAGIAVSGSHVVLSRLVTHFPQNTAIQFMKTGVGFFDDVLLEAVEKTGSLWRTALSVTAVFQSNKKHISLLIPNITLPIALTLGSLYAILTAGKYIPDLSCEKTSSEEDYYLEIKENESDEDDFAAPKENIYPATWQDLIKEGLDALGSLTYTFLILEKFGLFGSDSWVNLLSPSIPVALFLIMCATKNHYFVFSRVLIIVLDLLKNISLGAAFLDFGFSLYAATHHNKISTPFMWSWIGISVAYTLFECLTILIVQIYAVIKVEKYDVERLKDLAERLLRQFSREWLQAVKKERVGKGAHFRHINADLAEQETGFNPVNTATWTSYQVACHEEFQASRTNKSRKK